MIPFCSQLSCPGWAMICTAVCDKTLVLTTQPQCNRHRKTIPDWPMDTTWLLQRQQKWNGQGALCLVYTEDFSVRSEGSGLTFTGATLAHVFIISLDLSVWWNWRSSHHCKVVKAVDGKEHSIYSPLSYRPSVLLINGGLLASHFRSLLCPICL